MPRNLHHRSTSLGCAPWLMAAAVVAIIVGGIIWAVAYANSGVDRLCTVTDKDRTTTVTNGSSSTDVRVWTEECGVLSLNDSLIGMSYDTADKYGQIEVGKTYQFHTLGWRIPFLSEFPNITEINEAP